MHETSRYGLHLDRPNVVGTFHSYEKEIEKNLHGIDAIEFRLDLLEKFPSQNEVTMCEGKPLIMTARHSAEGGNRNLDNAHRFQLLRQSMPLAAFVDLELRIWEEASSIVEFARESGVGLVASFHDFSGTPPLSELIEKAHLSQQLGADIFKVATYLNSPSDLACLLQLKANVSSPLSVMGMGSFGMVSRLTLACCGSVLNYGWLGSPLVAGQWPAGKFAEILNTLLNT